MSSPQDFMMKAKKALTSAKVLLNESDADGACNRAYYAMFDAARAALLTQGIDSGRTHKGVLNVFSEKLVKTGIAGKTSGRQLKHAEALRYVADYDGDFVSPDDAAEMIMQADAFVAEMSRIVDSRESL